MPSSVDYFQPETGQRVGRVVFDYSEPAHIQSVHLTPGEDGEWQTGDDTEAPFLECLYAFDPDALPRQRYLPMQAIARSPTGAIAIALLDMPDGEYMYCPPLARHWLRREARCTGATCPDTSSEASFYNGYSLNMSRSSMPGELVEAQALTAYLDGVPQAPLSQKQITHISLDEHNRPLTVDIDVVMLDIFSEIIVSTCDVGSNLAVELFLFRSCKILKESVTYSYAGDLVTREVDYYHGEVYSHTEHSTRTWDEEAGVYTFTSDVGFVSGDPAPLVHAYSLNAHGQVTASVKTLAGDDLVLGTDDDEITVGNNYLYRADGQPASTWQTEGDGGTHYVYDSNDRLVRATLYQQGRSTPVREYRYQYDGRVLLEESEYVALSEEAPALLLSKVVRYELAKPGFPANFHPDRPQRPGRPTLSSLMARFDLSFE